MLLLIHCKVIPPLNLKDGRDLPTSSYVAVQSIAQRGRINCDFDGFKLGRHCKQSLCMYRNACWSPAESILSILLNVSSLSYISKVFFFFFLLDSLTSGS